jgi:hypothetical protein
VPIERKKRNCNFLQRQKKNGWIYPQAAGKDLARRFFFLPRRAAPARRPPRRRPGGGGGPRTAVESVCATGDLDLPRRRAFVTHIGEAEEGEATAEKKGRRDADSVLALLRWSPSTPSREPR